MSNKVLFGTSDCTNDIWKVTQENQTGTLLKTDYSGLFNLQQTTDNKTFMCENTFYTYSGKLAGFSDAQIGNISSYKYYTDNEGHNRLVSFVDKNNNQFYPEISAQVQLQVQKEVLVTGTTPADNYVCVDKLKTLQDNLKASTNYTFAILDGKIENTSNTQEVAMNMPTAGTDAATYYCTTTSVTASTSDIDQKLNAYNIEDVNDVDNLYSVDASNKFTGITCRGTNRGGNMLWPGNSIHRIIQYYYQTLNQYALKEYIIPGAGVKINPKNGKYYAGYADIVNPPTGEMFEIKEASDEGDGNTEVGNYINLANSAVGCSPASQPQGCAPCIWNRGTNFIPPPLFTEPNTGKVVTVSLSTRYKGVILYEAKDPSQVPDYVSVPLPKSIQDAIDKVTSRINQKRGLQPALSLFDAVKSSCKGDNCPTAPVDVQTIVQFMKKANDGRKAVQLAQLIDEIISTSATALTEDQAVEVALLILCL